MPELPEVETVLRGLQPTMEGQYFAGVTQNRPDLRFKFPDNFVARVTGRTVTGLSRRAKYLLAHLDNGETLVMHLGMSGRFVVCSGVESCSPGRFYQSQGAHPRHTHVVFKMSGGAEIHYNDVRRFGFMTLVAPQALETHKLFCHLGVEPIGSAFDERYLAAKAQNKAVTVKNLLMDQKVVAGLGNIYVCEALYRAGIAPVAAASILVTKAGKPSAKARRLVPAIQNVLTEAIDAGGSSLRDHRQTNGALGYFQHSFSVYGRVGESCKTRGCDGTIRRIAQNGRSSFYCPHCQRAK